MALSQKFPNFSNAYLAQFWSYEHVLGHFGKVLKSSNQFLWSQVILIYQYQVMVFDLKCLFVDFWKWPIMLKLITFCESISWSRGVNMCCTPKFSLPYSSRFAQGLDSQTPPKPVEIRVLVISKNLRFSMAHSSLIWLHTFSSIHMASFKTHSVNLLSQKLHLTYSKLQGKNGHFVVKSQNFWSTSYFEATIIIWSNLDHDSSSMAQKSSRCKSFHFWTVEKSTVTWPRHNFFMVHQKNPI